MFKQIFTTFSLTCLLLSGTVAAQNPVSPVPMDHRVKAAFLVKFIRYVDWPSTEGKDTFNMGVFGDSPIAENLFSIMPKTIDGWKLNITRIENVKDSLDCHLVFLSSSEAHRYSEIIGALKDLEVLTVSDTRNFLDIGGMINFLIVDHLVRIDSPLSGCNDPAVGQRAPYSLQ